MKPEGLDVFKLDRDGRADSTVLTLSAAFASPTIAKVVDSGDFPQLREIWDYKSTTVSKDRIPLLREQVAAVIGRLPPLVTAEARSELEALLRLLDDAAREGVGILAEGP